MEAAESNQVLDMQDQPTHRPFKGKGRSQEESQGIEEHRMAKTILGEDKAKEAWDDFREMPSKIGCTLTEPCDEFGHEPTGQGEKEPPQCTPSLSMRPLNPVPQCNPRSLALDRVRGAAQSAGQARLTDVAGMGFEANQLCKFAATAYFKHTGYDISMEHAVYDLGELLAANSISLSRTQIAELCLHVQQTSGPART